MGFTYLSFSPQSWQLQKVETKRDLFRSHTRLCMLFPSRNISVETCVNAVGTCRDFGHSGHSTVG